MGPAVPGQRTGQSFPAAARAVRGRADGADGRLRRITYSEQPVALDLTQNDPRMDGLDRDHPGAKLIARTTCLACHMTKQKSIGPTYRDVARKYAEDPKGRDTLAAKILSGGVGVWGPVPMPPHPQHNIEETQQMVDAILGFLIHGSVPLRSM